MPPRQQPRVGRVAAFAGFLRLECLLEPGFDSGPEKAEQAPRIRRPQGSTVRTDGRVTDQMQALACPRAGYIEQATDLMAILAGLVQFNEAVDGVVLEVRPAPDRTDYLPLVSVLAGDVGPAEYRSLAPARRSPEPVQQHVIELQALGAVHGHHLQTCRAVIRDTFEIKLRLQLGYIVQRSRNLEFSENIEVAIHVPHAARIVKDCRSAELQPGTLNTVAQRRRARDTAQGLDDRHRPIQCPARFVRKRLQAMLVVQEFPDRTFRVACDESMQVVPVPAHPGGTQQGQPCKTVTGMNHGARERQQVDDLRQVGQAVDIDGLVVDSCGPESRQQRGQLGAPPHQHGHVILRIRGKRLAYDPATLLGFPIRIGTEQRIDLAVAFHRQSGHRFRIGHGAPGRIILRRKYLGEYRVEPVDEKLPRTEVLPQYEPFQRQHSDARILCQQELGDLRVSEPVDRLHRIADAKQGAAVIGLPAPRQCFQHPVLSERRVLHLIDQDMPQLVVQEQCDISRGFGRAQRLIGSDRYFDEIGQLMRAEQLLQLGDGHGQQAKQGKQHGPLRVAVPGRRQGTDLVNQSQQLWMTGRGFDDVVKRFFLAIVARRETVVYIDALTPATSRREQ